MRVTFLGTGTSTGVPALTCACPVCRSQDPRDRRLRPSAWLRWGEASVLIDTSSDLRQQALGQRNSIAGLRGKRLSKLERAIDEHRRGNNLTGEADRECFRRWHHPSGGEPFEGPRFADETCREPRCAEIWNEADLNPGRNHSRILGEDPDIGGKRKAKPRASYRTIDRRDHWLCQCGQPQQPRMERAAQVHRVGLGPARSKIAPGAEILARSGDHNGSARFVLGLVPRPVEPGEQGGIECVGLVRAVQRDEQHCAVTLDNDRRLRVRPGQSRVGRASRITVLVSRNGSSPSRPPSRPTPDCLKPPKAMPKSLRCELWPTVPARSRRATA